MKKDNRMVYNEIILLYRYSDIILANFLDCIKLVSDSL